VIKLLVAQYIIMFRSVKTVKQLAFELGVSKEYARQIEVEIRKTGFVTVPSKINHKSCKYNH